MTDDDVPCDNHFDYSIAIVSLIIMRESRAFIQCTVLHVRGPISVWVLLNNDVPDPAHFRYALMIGQTRLRKHKFDIFRYTAHFTLCHGELRLFLQSSTVCLMRVTYCWGHLPFPVHGTFYWVFCR